MRIEKDQTLYEFIKEKTYNQNKSLNQLAKEIDLSYPTINNLRHRKPSRLTYHRLANYFDIDVIDLFEYPIKK